VKRGDVIPIRSSTGGSFPVTFQSEGQCRGCEAFILWTRTPRGKSMPVDARSEKDGVYVSHFSTCTKRDEFRGAP